MTSATGVREAEALNERGTLYRVSGELALAQECHQRSLELSREIDSSWDEAHALAGLGRCALAAGRAAQAESLLRQALEIFQRIGAAEAQELLAELDALAGARPHSHPKCQMTDASRLALGPLSTEAAGRWSAR